MKGLFKNNLNLKDEIIIERAHRGGVVYRNNRERPRTMIIKLLNYNDKERILKQTHRLKGGEIYIKEDFSRETMEIRQSLWPKVQELRQQGKYAIIKYDRIVSHAFKSK